MEKQMPLFNLPEKINIKRRKPLFRVEIISEKDGEIFVFWKRAWIKTHAKKFAATEYNDMCGYNKETPVKFGKVKKKIDKKKEKGIKNER